MSSPYPCSYPPPAFVSDRSSRIPNEEDEMDEEEEDSDDKKAAVFGALDGVLTSFAIVAGAAGRWGSAAKQAVLFDTKTARVLC